MASQKFNQGHVASMSMDMHKEALAAETSDPVLIGGGYRSVSVGVGAVVGNTVVQYTLDTVAAVEAGTAEWHDWASGTVTANAADNLDGPVTALRCTTATSCEWFINAAGR